MPTAGWGGCSVSPAQAHGRQLHYNYQIASLISINMNQYKMYCVTKKMTLISVILPSCRCCRVSCASVSGCRGAHRSVAPSPLLTLLFCFSFCCPEDDVDLETLMDDMNTSLESLYPSCSMQSDTVPLCQNGQHSRSQPPPSGAKSLQAQLSPWQKVQRSQPVHILAVRWDPGPRGRAVLLGRRAGAACWGDGGQCGGRVGRVRATGGHISFLCLA